MSNRSIRSLSYQNRLNDSVFCPIFYKEIANIMHGAGDSPTPHEESVILVEKIVKHELSSIIDEALHVLDKTTDHDNLVITHDNIFFILRKNPCQLMRIQKYLKDLDSCKKIEKNITGKSEINHYTKDEIFNIVSEMQDLYNLPDYCDNDYVNFRKLDRAEKMSRILNNVQYAAYAVARQTSFCNNSAKAVMAREQLMKWLIPNNDVKLIGLSLQIIGFLLHEIVTVIVDMALLIRQEQGLQDCSQIRPISEREITEAVRRYSVLHCGIACQHSDFNNISRTTVFL